MHVARNASQRRSLPSHRLPGSSKHMLHQRTGRAGSRETPLPHKQEGRCLPVFVLVNALLLERLSVLAFDWHWQSAHIHTQCRQPESHWHSVGWVERVAEQKLQQMLSATSGSCHTEHGLEVHPMASAYFEHQSTRLSAIKKMVFCRDRDELRARDSLAT
jgi:hypothetical protein